MIRERVLHALTIVISLWFSSGCAVLWLGAGAAAGAGAVAYVRGELRSTEEVSLERAWRATRSAMDELQLFVSSREKDALSAGLTARGADDKKIRVSLRRKSDTLTEIRIRVGIFGDESLSRLILQTIRRRFLAA